MSNSAPDADALLLVGQLPPMAAVVVVALHGAGGGAKEVLGAAIGGQVRVVAGVLGGLCI